MPDRLKPTDAERRAEFWAALDDALFDSETIGAAFHYKVATLDAFAIRGGGPKYLRIGRRRLYRKGDVIAWAVSTGRVLENTAQLRAVAA